MDKGFGHFASEGSHEHAPHPTLPTLPHFAACLKKASLQDGAPMGYDGYVQSNL